MLLFTLWFKRNEFDIRILLDRTSPNSSRINRLDSLEWGRLTVYSLEKKVQLCIVHMVRHILKYVSWKTRKEVAAALKLAYACATVEQASQAMDEFETVLGKDFPPILQSWWRNWVLFRSLTIHRRFVKCFTRSMQLSLSTRAFSRLQRTVDHFQATKP